MSRGALKEKSQFCEHVGPKTQRAKQYTSNNLIKRCSMHMVLNKSVILLAHVNNISSKYKYPD